MAFRIAGVFKVTLDGVFHYRDTYEEKT